MVFVCIALFSVPAAFAAQSAVNLGTAGNFVIVAKSGISTTGTTSIVGDIGVSPAAATFITGFGLIIDPSNQFSSSSLVTGKIYAADYTPPTPINMGIAIGDMQTAYTDAAGRTLPDHTELGAGDISGMTLAPGLYKWGTGVIINNGVTLDCAGDANGVYIFQIAKTLTVGNGAIVTLSGGCQAKNIFWQVAGQATLGTTSSFQGNILGQTAIVLNNGATLYGRALAQTAVTLDASAFPVAVLAPTPVLTSIVISPLLANVVIGFPLQLSATHLDQFGNPIATNIYYASSNPSIATVNPTNGLVTAVSSGNAIITASSGSVSGSADITVTSSPAPPVVIIPIPNGGGYCLVGYAISSPASVDMVSGTAKIPVTVKYTGTCSGIVSITATVPAGWTATSANTTLMGINHPSQTVNIIVTAPSNAVTSSIAITGAASKKTFTTSTTVNVAAIQSTTPAATTPASNTPATTTQPPLTGTPSVTGTEQNGYMIPALAIIIAAIVAIALYAAYKIHKKSKIKHV